MTENEEENLLSELKEGGDEFEKQAPSKVDVVALGETFDRVVVQDEQDETVNMSVTATNDVAPTNDEPTYDHENEAADDDGNTVTATEDEQEKKTDVEESDEHVKRAKSGELEIDEQEKETDVQESDEYVKRAESGELENNEQEKETDVEESDEHVKRAESGELEIDEQEKETDVEESDEHVKKAESGELDMIVDEQVEQKEPKKEDALKQRSEVKFSEESKETNEIVVEEKVVAEEEKDLKSDYDEVGKSITKMMSGIGPTTAGDFKIKTDSDPDFQMSGSAIGLLSMSSEESIFEEVEPEEEIEEEEYVEPIDRDKYLEMYRTLLQEKAVLRRKNMVIQRKLVEYFRKRKMESAIREYDTRGVDLEQKYFRKLYVYEELKTVEERERSTIKGILKELRDERDEVIEELRETLEKLIEKERQVGTGLINAQSGKPIPDKSVERLLSRQRSKAKEVGKVRLVYIKVRDRVAASEAVLRALETLGEGLHLIDYEQLRMENQNYDDKIEEREEELTRLRTKATSSIQILAHVREKSNATLADIEEVVDRLDSVDADVAKEREHVGELKHRRDCLRDDTIRLRNEAGLLTHHRLLRDFEESIEETTRVSAQLQNLKNTFHDQMRSLASVRRSINMAVSGQSLRSVSASSSSSYLSKTRGKSLTSTTSAIKSKMSEGSLTLVKGKRPSFFPTQHQKALDNFLTRSNY